MVQNYDSIEKLDEEIAKKDIEFKKLSQIGHRLSAEIGILKAQRQILTYTTTISSLDEEIEKSEGELSDTKK